PMSPPTRRIRSPCCARSANGQAPDAPPRRAMNSRLLTLISPVCADAATLSDLTPVAVKPLLHRNVATLARTAQGLGRVKTQACCGAVEWRSQTQMFFPSRARLTSLRPVTQRRRNLENSAVPTFLARDSRLARVLLCSSRG